MNVSDGFVVLRLARLLNVHVHVDGKCFFRRFAIATPDSSENFLF